MIDKLTIYQGKYNKTLLGSYYETAESTAIPFDYEIIDPKARTFDTLQNLGVSKFRTLSIKTNDPIEWKIKGLVALQTGGLFEITQVREDIGQAPKQAYRSLQTTLGIEYVLNLVEIDNPYNLK